MFMFALIWMGERNWAPVGILLHKLLHQDSPYSWKLLAYATAGFLAHNWAPVCITIVMFVSEALDTAGVLWGSGIGVFGVIAGCLYLLILMRQFYRSYRAYRTLHRAIDGVARIEAALNFQYGYPHTPLPFGLGFHLLTIAELKMATPGVFDLRSFAYMATPPIAVQGDDMSETIIIQPCPEIPVRPELIPDHIAAV